MKKVIGIIGPIGVGKDTCAEYIAKKTGAGHFQISQPIKDIALSKGLSTTRETLIEIGRTISQEKGPTYLAEYILDQINSIGIITGMRMLEQIDFLRKNSDFFLISIDADPKTRFERVKDRGKLGEADSLEEFIERERLENSGTVQRLFECMKLADYSIMNNGTIKDLSSSIDEILEKQGL